MEVAERTCVFLMLNPSTADEDKLDPTVTRCVAHAKRWHFDAMTVLNLFAWRATDPADMKAAEEPIGKLNDAIIREVTSKAAMTVLAFGNHAAHLDRYQFVGCLPQDRLFFFQKNKTGHPKHPLYVSKQADLYRWQDGSIVTIDEIRQKGRLDGAAGNAVQSRHDIGVKHGIST